MSMEHVSSYLFLREIEPRSRIMNGSSGTGGVSSDGEETGTMHRSKGTQMLHMFGRSQVKSRRSGQPSANNASSGSSDGGDGVVAYFISGSLGTKHGVVEEFMFGGDASPLTRDLRSLPRSDQTDIGERGLICLVARRHG